MFYTITDVKSLLVLFLVKDFKEKEITFFTEHFNQKILQKMKTIDLISSFLLLFICSTYLGYITLFHCSTKVTIIQDPILLPPFYLIVLW